MVDEQRFELELEKILISKVVADKVLGYYSKSLSVIDEDLNQDNMTKSSNGGRSVATDDVRDEEDLESLQKSGEDILNKFFNGDGKTIH